MADKSKLNDKKASEIEKIDTTSLDLAKENLEKFKEIFPLAFSEDKLDIEKLKNFLGEKVINEYVLEKYGLNWAGKSQAFKAIRIPSTGTLVRDHKGVDEDNSENIFIEGDNLEVLKLLQKHYFNQIKMIYIDPPYNTGKDFVYKDNWTDDIESYYKLTGQRDDEGVKMVANTEKNGRFHSDWLTMMYPRLFLARNLLKDDGVIFVSIDDNEVANLRLIMDEIFGEENFVGQFIRRTRSGGGFGTSDIGIEHDYVISYSKNIGKNSLIKLNKDELDLKMYFNKTDKKGEYHARELKQSDNQAGSREERPYMFFPFVFINNVINILPIEEYKNIYKNGAFDDEYIEKLNKKYKNIIWPIRKDGNYGRWGCGYETAIDLLNEGDLFAVNNKIFKKERLSEEREGKVITTLLNDNCYTNTNASLNLRSLLSGNFFDFPKPVKLLKDLLSISTQQDDIILDFFAGSGTTAHAVMDLNAADGGQRKWICVQLPELTDEKSEAYKAGYKTISEISRERIKRVGEKIKKEYKGEKDIQDLDLGFKTFTLKNSNYRRWQTLDDENTTEDILAQAKLFLDKPLVDGYKETDVVEEIILKEGFDLNSKVVKEKDMYVVSEMDGEEVRRILITFAKFVNEEMVEKLKLKETDIFICLDSALTDSSKTNLSRERFNLKVI